tara:strand:+ start:409 stop:1068 length:660 start_codon:yes stop_codon:yes gene_type:complete
MTSITSRKEDYNFITGEEKKGIISAIRRGSKKELIELISDKDLNRTFLADENSILEEDQFTGITILHQAVNLKKKKIVQYLLSKGSKNIPEYNCSLGLNSSLNFTPFDDAINQKNFEIAYLIENTLGENIVVSSTLVGKECIDEYNLWKIDRRKKKDEEKKNLLEEMTRGLKGLKIERIDSERIDSEDEKDSKITDETPNTSLEYERYEDSDASDGSED